MSECKREYPNCGSPTACDMCRQLEIMQKEKQELLELLNKTVEQLKSARYCIEEGDCALEAGPDWMYDIQEMIEEKLQKYEGDNNE